MIRFPEAGILVVMICVLATSACSRNQGRTLQPEQVAEDFAVSRERAATKYRRLWEGKELTNLDRATLAGELYAADPTGEAEYRAFIESAALSSDDAVAAAGAGSFRYVPDAHAIRALVELAESDRAPVARAAGHALNFKQQEVRGGSTSGPEARLVEQAIERLCANSSLAPYVREVTCQ